MVQARKAGSPDGPDDAFHRVRPLRQRLLRRPVRRIRDVECEGAYAADRVIAVSGALADEMKWQYHVPDWKIRVIPNGVNCGEFDGFIDPAVCRRTYGVGPLDPMVLSSAA